MHAYKEAILVNYVHVGYNFAAGCKPGISC